MITEHTLVLDLRKTLAADIPHAVVLKHSAYITAGIPDISVTFSRRTSWLEVKLARPFVKGTALQQHTARQLALAGVCWYIVYEQTTKTQRTCIVRPMDIDDRGHFTCPADRVVSGFNHKFVAQFLRTTHG